MNKKLFIVKNAIVLFNIILLAGLSLMKFCVVDGFNIPLLHLLLLALLIITVFDISKKRKKINYNSEYNLIFIISNIVVMIILLRGLFDTTIVSNVFDPVNYRYANTWKMSFVVNNLIYINIIYSCLILYRLTLIERKKVKHNEGIDAHR